MTLASLVAPVTTASQRPAAPPTFVPLSINASRCKGCGICVDACTKGALELDEGRVNALGYHPVMLMDPSACSSCAICARVCPDAVFTVFAPPKARGR